MAAQKDVIKDNYWVLDTIMDKDYKKETHTNGTAGSTIADQDADAAADPYDPVPATSDCILKLAVGVDNTSNGGQVLDPAYFVRGAAINVFTKDSTGKSYRLEFKVKDQADASKTMAGVSGFVYVLCTFTGGINASNTVGGSANEYNPSAVKSDLWGQNKIMSIATAPGTAGQGIVTIGTNNVNDFERWCENRPALNTNKHVPFWFQTSRYTLCVDQFYKEWLERMMRTNQYFQKFGDVSLAERNAQLGLMFQKEWVNSFFFGGPISGDQTLANYKSLATVQSYDPTGTQVDFDTGMESKAIGYRANAVGIYRQLANCGRVKDHRAAANFNLRTFIEEDLFNLTRSRKDQGKPADSIDIFTDSKTAKNIFNAMMKYYAAESPNGDSLRLNYDISNQNIANLGFYANSYKLHYPAGVTMNVITNEFFDDLVTASKYGDASTLTDGTDGSNNRFLMILDLGGGIYPGIIGSNRVVHTTGELNELARVNTDYACVMANPTKETTLNSLTWTAVVECPSDNLIVENIRDAAMVVT